MTTLMTPLIIKSSDFVHFDTNSGPPSALPALINPGIAGLRRVAEVLVTRQELWLPLAGRVLDDGCAAPTRVAGLAGWEAWLHVWPAGASTAWHRHHGPVAAALISGELRELRDQRPRASGSSPHGSRPHGRHALVNDGDTAAVTLNVYALPSPLAGRSEAQLCRPIAWPLTLRGEEAS